MTPNCMYRYLSRLVYFSVTILSSLCSAQAFTDSSIPSNNIIMVYGDSLSSAYEIPLEQGWVHLVDQKVQAKFPDWKLINLSISGQTTGGAAPRLSKHLEQHRPKYLIIELGGNDGLRGVPLSRIRKNLEKMIATAMQLNTRVILFGMNLPANYGPVYTKEFHGIYQSLARAHDLAWVPSFLEPIADRNDLFQDDGIHPTAAAQPILAEHVWPVIKRAIMSQHSSSDQSTFQ